ncbi:MAG: hypothetical protein AB2L14_33530 [Candidatus Xenobiia bacterium LiM19]
MPHLLSVIALTAMLLILLTGTAHACQVCIYEMMSLYMPFLADWYMLFISWLVWVLVLKLIYHTLTGEDIRKAARWGGILLLAWCFCLGYIATVVCMLYWLKYYMNSITKLLKKEAVPRDFRAVTAAGSVLFIGLIVMTVYNLDNKGPDDIRYRLSRLAASSGARALRYNIATKGLLSDSEIIDLARNGDRNQRYNAVIIMGETKRTVFIPPLIEMLKTRKSDTYRQCVVNSLQEISGKAFGDDPEKWDRWLSEQNRL